MKSNYKTQLQIISQIGRRALLMYLKHGGTGRDMIDFVMDIECVHQKTPLNLTGLLAADDFNFSHDVFGIAKHLNRETRQLENCFVPRFTLPVA